MLRRAKKPSPVDLPVETYIARMEKRLALVQAELYAEGVQHGVEIALRSILGEDLGEATGYKGELPPALRAWAVAALARGVKADPKGVAAEAIAKVEQRRSRQRDHITEGEK